VIEQGNKRHPIAHTLTKGEVRGGGKKPHKQKHTGWARQGSSRNPHFRGGGVAFGPRNTRNFKKRAPQTERRTALFACLSDKYKEGCIAALESFEANPPKTKTFATMMKKLPFEKKTLFIIPEKNDSIMRSSRNLPSVKTILVNYINIADILNYQNIVFFNAALPKLEEIFLK
jgi:large subunit ribosomal protein L4